MLATWLTGVLATEGFQRHGQTWSRPSGAFIDVVNTQISKSGGEMTINAGVCAPELYVECWGRPLPTPIDEANCTVRVRVAELIDGRDRWWPLDDASAPQEASELVRTHVLPFLDRMHSAVAMEALLTREQLQFDVQVTTVFGDLLSAFGLVCTTTSATFVRYESDEIFVNVYHGRRSYELGVEIGRLSDAAPYAYRAEDVVGALVSTGPVPATHFQSSSREGIESSVRALASLVERHYQGLLRGDPDAWGWLEASTARRNEFTTKWMVQRPIRREANAAWQAKDYGKVIDLYGSIADDLTNREADEQRKAFAGAKAMRAKLP